MRNLYAVTDLHGRYDLWEQIKNYIKEDDIIIFLGDAADRGPNGFKLIKELLENPQVIYLKGNHENFFIENIIDALEEEHHFYMTRNGLLWHSNGGEATINDTKASNVTIREIKNIIKKLKNLPEIYEMTNDNNQLLILSHAGFDINAYEGNCKNPKTRSMRSWGYDNDPLWDRSHFYCDWTKDEKFKDAIMIHGHTPCPVFYSRFLWTGVKNELGEEPQVEKNEIMYYCNGHKINLDLGSFLTNKIALFNLNTLKVEKYFEIKESEGN